MRKRSLIAAIVVSLACGAVITVVVAFACSARSSMVRTRSDATDQVPDLIALIPAPWLEPQFPQTPGGMMSTYADEYKGFGLLVVDLAVSESIPGWSRIGFNHILFRRQAGWPFLALECSENGDISNPRVIDHGIPVPGWLDKTTTTRLMGIASLGRQINPMLPLKPTLGFAFDTLLYATLSFFLLCGPHFISRAMRTMRGRCLACGYSRAGLLDGAPCPECGKMPKVRVE